MAYVYEHWRPDTDQCFYVGKGDGRRARKISNGRNIHHSRVVEKLRRSGLDVEIRIIADGISDAEALAMEVDRIALYGLNNLTNQTAGGEGVLRPTAEVRKKMSDHRQQLLNDPEFRERHRLATRAAMTPEWRKKMGDIKRGKKQTPETVAKRSAAMKGRKRPEQAENYRGERNPFFGKRHSEETLKAIADKKRGSKMSEETREKMRASQAIRREKEALSKPPKNPQGTPPRKPYKHSPETIAKMKIIAKARGVSDVTRMAHRVALTGRKRSPFTDETIAKMRLAAAAREAAKRREA